MVDNDYSKLIDTVSILTRRLILLEKKVSLLEKNPKSLENPFISSNPTNYFGETNRDDVTDEIIENIKNGHIND